MIEHAFLRAVVIDVIIDPASYKATPEGKSFLEQILDMLKVTTINL